MASPARGNASGKGGLEKEPTEIRHSGVNGIGLSLRRPAARPFIIATFFLSSRRRHTRSYGDWRSDVCSSDLFRHRVMAWHWALAALGVAIALYLLANGDDFFDRSILPNSWDVLFGVALIVLVLEAMRRATGWIMPVITLFFLLYAIFGPYLPAPWTHKGYEIPRLIGHMYMTLEGIYGVAVDVSSSLIILFTVYGAFLQYSGAGKFYIDFSFSAMGGKPTGAGRTVVLASFLLGGPSGSGVATTVTLGLGA